MNSRNYNKRQNMPNVDVDIPVCLHSLLYPSVPITYSDGFQIYQTPVTEDYNLYTSGSGSGVIQSHHIVSDLILNICCAPCLCFVSMLF